MADPQFPEHHDRAVQALINDGWLGEWDTPIEPTDLANGVALVLRIVRDDIVMAWQEGRIEQLLDVEALLNARIATLTMRPTTTGDTTT